MTHGSGVCKMHDLLYVSLCDVCVRPHVSRNKNLESL